MYRHDEQSERSGRVRMHATRMRCRLREETDPEQGIQARTSRRSVQSDFGGI